MNYPYSAAHLTKLLMKCPVGTTGDLVTDL